MRFTKRYRIMALKPQFHFLFQSIHTRLRQLRSPYPSRYHPTKATTTEEAPLSPPQGYTNPEPPSSLADNNLWALSYPQ